jgi:hypothetical protein
MVPLAKSKIYKSDYKKFKNIQTMPKIVYENICKLYVAVSWIVLKVEKTKIFFLVLMKDFRF